MGSTGARLNYPVRQTSHAPCGMKTCSRCLADCHRGLWPNRSNIPPATSIARPRRSRSCRLKECQRRSSWLCSMPKGGKVPDRRSRSDSIVAGIVDAAADSRERTVDHRHPAPELSASSTSGSMPFPEFRNTSRQFRSKRPTFTTPPPAQVWPSAPSG